MVELKNDFQIRLQQAWSLRNSQKLGAAEKALRQLQASLLGSPLAAQKSQHLELKILEASLLRAQRRILESEKILLEVKKSSELAELPVSAKYYLQRGLNLYYQGYFPSALEFFVRCQEICLQEQDYESMAVAAGNQLFCLANLNLPTDKLIKKINSLRFHLTADYFNEVIHPPLQTHECSEAFRRGDFQSLYQYPPQKDFSQFEYLQLWTSQLPYVEAQACQTEVSRLLEAPHLIWKKYRIHTLLAEGRYEDEIEPKISEQVDRLYLWIWTWMTCPDSFPVSFIEKCWADLEPSRVCSQTTAEDLVLLRLCLRWCRLFDPRWERPSEEWMKKSLPSSLMEPPLFKLEGEVLDYFEAVKNKETRRAAKILTALYEQDLFNSPLVLFREMILGFKNQGDESRSINQLGRILGRKFKVRTTASAKLSIDLQSYRWRLGNQQGISKPLCVLLHRLQAAESLSFADVMIHCFDFRFYDESLHRDKIMNLLTRTRKLLPLGTEIITRQERVYLQGSLKSLTLHNATTLAAHWDLPLLLERPCLEMNKNAMARWAQPRLMLQKIKNHKTVNRAHIQKLFRLSKASANRLIKRWSDEGFLKKQNAGRSISYVVDSEHFSHLNSSDS